MNFVLRPIVGLFAVDVCLGVEMPPGMLLLY